MPGLLSASGAESVGTVAGMKRVFADEAPASNGERQVKKRKVVHKLHHTQPTQHIPEFISAETDSTGLNKDFFDQQLLRAIAIQCKAAGFEGSRPEALEEFRGLVDGYMRQFLAQVRKSMSSARRTTTVTHDWVYALKLSDISGSSLLEKHLDTRAVSPSFLQPTFPPPDPTEPPPPDLDGLLGPGLSGKADKEALKFIPSHFPPFPSKHTYKATPVFTQRENDPRKIREKATEEGILAEQSLRKLMAAQKAGLQKNKARKQNQSKRIKESDALWHAAMKEAIVEEENRAERELQRAEEASDDEWDHERPPITRRPEPRQERKVTSDEGVHVNYDQKFYRKSARGF